MTGYHPLYSVTRGNWVKVKSLKEGEVLQTYAGTQTLVKKERAPGRFKVINLEVEAEHRYFAGHLNLLSHNAHQCVIGQPGTKPNEGNSRDGNDDHDDELRDHSIVRLVDRCLLRYHLSLLRLIHSKIIKRLR